MIASVSGTQLKPSCETTIYGLLGIGWLATMGDVNASNIELRRQDGEWQKFTILLNHHRRAGVALILGEHGGGTQVFSVRLDANGAVWLCVGSNPISLRFRLAGKVVGLEWNGAQFTATCNGRSHTVSLSGKRFESLEAFAQSEAPAVATSDRETV